MNQATIRGRTYEVGTVNLLADIAPRLRADMEGRGFDAYGFVKFPRGGSGLVYRAAKSGEWLLVARG